MSLVGPESPCYNSDTELSMLSKLLVSILERVQEKSNKSICILSFMAKRSRKILKTAIFHYANILQNSNIQYGNN